MSYDPSLPAPTNTLTPAAGAEADLQARAWDAQTPLEYRYFNEFLQQLLDNLSATLALANASGAPFGGPGTSGSVPDPGSKVGWLASSGQFTVPPGGDLQSETSPALGADLRAQGHAIIGSVLEGVSGALGSGQRVNASGAMILNFTGANDFAWLLTGNVTSIAMQGLAATGKMVVFSLELTQDATGGRSFTAPGSWHLHGFGVSDLDTSPNASHSLIGYTYDGGESVEAFLAGAQLPAPLSGSATERPEADSVAIGTLYFDTSLGRPVWSDGSTWVDPVGGTTTSPTHYSLDLVIATGADDAQFTDSGVFNASGALLYLDNIQADTIHYGLRFTQPGGFSIPASGSNLVATLGVKSVGLNASPPAGAGFDITAFKEATCAAFTGGSEMLARAKTAAAVSFTPASWADGELFSVDVSSVITELLADENGITNAIGIRTTAHKVVGFGCDSYDGNPATCPTLHLEWDA